MTEYNENIKCTIKNIGDNIFIGTSHDILLLPELLKRNISIIIRCDFSSENYYNIIRYYTVYIKDNELKSYSMLIDIKPLLKRYIDVGRCILFCGRNEAIRNVIKHLITKRERKQLMSQMRSEKLKRKIQK